jgi:hypothetical protein
MNREEAVVRYQLSNEEADPKTLLAAPEVSHHLAEVVESDTGGARSVLQDFVNAFQPRELARLKELTDAGIGFGVEIASSRYDDDLERGDEPFAGVLIRANFRNDEVVLSREAFKRLVDEMVALGQRVR